MPARPPETPCFPRNPDAQRSRRANHSFVWVVVFAWFMASLSIAAGTWIACLGIGALADWLGIDHLLAFIVAWLALSVPVAFVVGRRIRPC